MNVAVASEVGQVAAAEPKVDRAQILRDVLGVDYAKTFDDPVLFVDKRWVNRVCKQFYLRDFGLISRILFLEVVYRRRWEFNEAVLDSFSALANKKLDDIMKLLTTKVERLELVCKSNNATEDTFYQHPREILAPVIAPGARRWLQCLDLLDRLYSLLGKALLHGIVDLKERNKEEIFCRKAVRAYGAMLRSESAKLRKEALRARQSSGTAVSAEEQQMEQSVAEAELQHDNASAEDSRADPDAVVAAEAAGQVIADLGATAAATAAASKKGPRRKSEAPDPASTEAAPAAAAATATGT